ncbi:hypothetical protein BN341_7700 [Helicobacter heilmannii ASB1.4]|uniref:Uncharacterized protein n=1 Tax=Helicobacter heilmannii TaxID=35817 RepID=A0A0K2Y6I6_HELHE|nr:hypothetical protein BN341_7700 [Helicobacter heilmannii ASB1.4]CRI34473.1 hypothetical protein HHE01_13190 [Helicobacter heilmannii]
MVGDRNGFKALVGFICSVVCAPLANDQNTHCPIFNPFCVEYRQLQQ